MCACGHSVNSVRPAISLLTKQATLDLGKATFSDPSPSMSDYYNMLAHHEYNQPCYFGFEMFAMKSTWKSGNEERSTSDSLPICINAKSYVQMG